MRIVISPDSFKGSISAIDAGVVMKEGFQSVLPDAHIDVIPMADGGEGTLDALMYNLNGKNTDLTATGPLNESVETAYGVIEDQGVVVIEVAKIIDITMVTAANKNPMLTTTFGVGEVIMHALDRGYRKFIIGLGGSATNDCGIGLLAALGGKFYNDSGEEITPIAASLKDVQRVDLKHLDKRIYESELTLASDVDVPLCGEQGASYMFGPQKGATFAQVQMLDQAIDSFSDLIEGELNLTRKHENGAGAAGGLGFAFQVIGAKHVSGAQVVEQSSPLKQKIEAADLVLTGEGQSDQQTLYGKVPAYVAKLAKRNGVHTILISGSIAEGNEELYDIFSSCHSIVSGPMTLQYAIDNVEALLYESCRNIARVIKMSIVMLDKNMKKGSLK